MYIRRRCTCIYVFSALPSPRDINFRTDVCARARARCVCVCVCAWKNVCKYVSKEAERGPHCEKRDERVQLEEVEEAGVKRDGKE